MLLTEQTRLIVAGAEVLFMSLFRGRRTFKPSNQNIRESANLIRASHVMSGRGRHRNRKTVKPVVEGLHPVHSCRDHQYNSSNSFIRCKGIAFLCGFVAGTVTDDFIVDLLIRVVTTIYERPHGINSRPGVVAEASHHCGPI